MSSSKIRPRLSSNGVLFPLDYVYARSGVGVPEAEVIEPDTIPQPVPKIERCPGIGWPGLPAPDVMKGSSLL